MSHCSYYSLHGNCSLDLDQSSPGSHEPMTTIKQSTVSRGHLVLSLPDYQPTTSTHGSGARIKAGQTISILGGGTFSNFLEPNLRQFEAELSSGEQVQGTSDCAEHQPLNPAVLMLATWHMTRGYLDTT